MKEVFTQSGLQGRESSILGNLDTYFFIIIVSILFHIKLSPIENISLDTVGISYLLIIYSGYKYGKYWGMLAGFISVGFWLLFVLISGNNIESLIGLRYWFFDYSNQYNFEITHFSFQSLIIFGFIGYLIGFIFDKVENWLQKQGVTLQELLPFRKRNFVLDIGKWIEKVSNALFLIQINQEDKNNYIKIRLRKLFILFTTIPLIVLYLSFSMAWSVKIAGVSVYFVPVLFSPVIALWLSHRINSTVGIWLSFSLLLTPFVYLFFKELNLFDGLLHIRNYSTPVTIAISMAIASWFIGTISKQLKNEELKNKIFKKVKKVKQKDSISTTNIAFIFLLSISFFYKDNGLSISYYSIFFLSLYIAWLSFKYNPLNVSNSVLITLGITSLFYTIISLGGGIWKLKLGGISMPEVVFLSIIPFAMNYIRLDSLRLTRILLLSIAVSISLLFIIFSYYDGNVLPDIFIKIHYGQNYFPLASLVLILLSSEILARFTWWRIKKT